MPRERKKPSGKYYTNIIPEKNPEYEKKISYFAKDNFWSKNFFTTASSNFLVAFLPSQDATVIKLLSKKKMILVGKTVLDEFACGGTGLSANTGPIFNPLNEFCITGGSSSGSAYSVAKGTVPVALSSDTGDSTRRPASYCGIVGFKPSYGAISRFGVIPMASSLDTVGLVGKKVKAIRRVFDIISQPDHLDLTTISPNISRKSSPTYAKKDKRPPKRSI